MNFCSCRYLPLTGPQANRNAWLIWAVFYVLICALYLMAPWRSVSQCYDQAGGHWMQGEPLYGEEGVGFLYLPHAAILYVPYALLSWGGIGELLWRLTTVGLFAWGIRRLARLGEADSGSDLFPLMTLLSIPLAFSAARNGQSTLLMAGCMMLAAADLGEHRWSRAAAWLLFGMIAKPLIAVMILLAAALHRQLLWRLLVGALVVALLPFAFQSTGYVLAQYGQFKQMLLNANELGNTAYWAQLFGMLKVTTGLEYPAILQNLIRLMVAPVTLYACWYARRRYSDRAAAVLLFAFAAVYLMLFNPRTENNTYAMLGPVIAWFLASEIVYRPVFQGRAAQRHLFNFQVVILTLAMIGCLGSYEIGRLISGSDLAIWLAPLCCVGFTGYLIYRLRRCPFMSRSGEMLASVDEFAAIDYADVSPVPIETPLLPTSDARESSGNESTEPRRAPAHLKSRGVHSNRRESVTEN